MWCAACRADVAAELSADNRRMLCARCQSELGMAAGAMERPALSVKSQDTERNARELLARWSTQQLLDPPITPISGSFVPAPVAPAPVSSAVVILPPGNSAPGNSAPVGRVAGNSSGSASMGTYSSLDSIPGSGTRRFDSAHAEIAPPVTPSGEGSPGEKPDHEYSSGGTIPAPKRRRKTTSRPRLVEESSQDPSQEHAVVAPASKSDDVVRLAVQQPLARQGNWTTTIGQLCAYGGVAVLTLGTVMVLAGYFGGPTNYAPTGWLVAAVGQMLLFLGVVTLVSGGMEQTVDEVAWRIDHLAEQVLRLERVIAEREAQLKEARRREIRRSKLSRDEQADAA